jgi:hypothetical protein
MAKKNKAPPPPPETRPELPDDGDELEAPGLSNKVLIAPDGSVVDTGKPATISDMLPVLADPPPVRTRAQAKAEAAKPEAPPLGSYRCVGEGLLVHDGATYRKGDVVRLSAAQAAQLGREVEPL